MLGFSTKATVLQVVCKSWLVGWPRLTLKSVNKLFSESEKMQKGHMKQQRQGVRSMKVQEANTEATNNTHQVLSNPAKPATMISMSKSGT